jgi:cysteine desulfurase
MMLVNNETGCVFPIAEVAASLKAVGSQALLHTDAVQGFLELPFRADTLGADFLAVSAHKIGGPKGVGALYYGPRVRNPRPLLFGGGQEDGLRGGTEATAQIAGFAEAVRLRMAFLKEHPTQLSDLKAYAAARLREIPDVQLIGANAAPHILCFSLVGYPSANVVEDLGGQGICLSAGSACHKGKPSHVVKALGLPDRVARGVLRVSFGPDSTRAEVDALCAALRRHHELRYPLL